MRTENSCHHRFMYAWLVMLLLVAGCSSEKHELPKAHVWQCLVSLNDEYEDYATYSYVLVGRDENNQPSALRYHKLIDAITGSTARISDSKGILSRESYNIFLIPVITCDASNDVKPNYDVSLKLLASLSAASEYPFTNPGPYIITLYKPIGKGQLESRADVLFLDMSTVHPSAMPEFVKTYKNHLAKHEIDGIHSLQSLRLSLLNLALVAEESIGFAQIAYASLQESFTEKPAPKP